MDGTLVGLKVEELHVTEAEGSLVFVTNAGIFEYEVDGDCCSESWFADVTGVDALIGGTVASVEEVPMPEPGEDGRSRQESDEAYGCKITTDKGHADVVFRNSSNGYYGGHCNSAKQLEELPQACTPISDDWRA